MHEACLQRFPQRYLVHPREHQHVATGSGDGDARDESVGIESRREAPRFLDRRRLPDCRHCSKRGRYRDVGLTRLRNFSRSAASSSKTPVKCEVMVEAPAFWTPRIAMQRCSASTMTATPRAPTKSTSAAEICAVIVSCVCNRFA